MAESWNLNDYKAGIGSLSIDSEDIEGLKEVGPATSTDNQYQEVQHGGLDFTSHVVKLWSTPQDFSVTAVWQASTFASLATKAKTRDTYNFVRTLGDGTEISGECYVDMPEEGAPIDDIHTMTFSVRVANQVTITEPGSGT